MNTVSATPSRAANSRQQAAIAPVTPVQKIAILMRRLLRDIAAGKETVGDTTTLEDYSVLAKLRGDQE